MQKRRNDFPILLLRVKSRSDSFRTVFVVYIYLYRQLKSPIRLGLTILLIAHTLLGNFVTENDTF